MTAAEPMLFDDSDVEIKRTCNLCGTLYPISHFRRPGRGRNWKRCETCRPSEGTWADQRRQMNREDARRRNLWRMYRITLEEYDERRAAQEYRCAICHRHEDDLSTNKTGRPRLDGKPTAEPMKLHVDHDHDTNAIRGLLCWSCNTGIGFFQDRTDWMAGAISYVTAGGHVQTTASSMEEKA